MLLNLLDSRIRNILSLSVCLLQKSLCGLKQSLSMWYWRLKKSYSDPLLFIYINDNEVVYLFTYVDDIVTTSSTNELVQEVISKLLVEFALRELGDLNFFLGIPVSRNGNETKLSQ